MSERIGERLAGNDEQGFSFTLIQLLVLTVIIGILLAVAVPSYLGFRDRAANNSARTNLRGALPSQRRTSRTTAPTPTWTWPISWRSIRVSRRPSPSPARPPRGTYCLTDTVSGKTWSVKGPAASDDGSSTDDWFTTSDCS